MSHDKNHRIAIRVDALSEDDMAAIKAVKVPAEDGYLMSDIAEPSTGDRLQALADAYPDAEYEVAGGLTAVMERAPGESDEEYEVALAAYRKLFAHKP